MAERPQIQFVKLPDPTDTKLNIRDYAQFMTEYELRGPHRPMYLQIGDEIAEIVDIRQMGDDAEVTVIRGARGTVIAGSAQLLS